MKKTLALLSLLLVSLGLTAQQNTFSKVYELMSPSSQIEKAFDGGFYILAYNNPIVIRTDQDGTIEWCREYIDNLGMIIPWQFKAMTIAVDSSVLIAGGAYNTFNGKAEILCIRLNIQGDTLWTRKIGNVNTHLFVNDIIQVADSGFLMTGYSGSQEAAFVAKLSATGELLWAGLYTANSSNTGNSVKQAPDGGYFVIGTIINYTNFDGNAFLLKLTPEGVVSWAKKFVGPILSSTTGNDIVVSDDSILGFLFLDDDLDLVKTDLNGNVIWNKSYSQPNAAMGISWIPPSMKLTGNDRLIIHNGGDWSTWIAQSDLSGNLLWARTVLLNGVDVAETHDHGYIVLGNGPLLGVKSLYDPQIGIVKTDSLGYSFDCVNNEDVVPFSASVTASPLTFTASYGAVASPIPLTITYPAYLTREGCVDVTGSIADKDISEKIMLYPNPSSGLVTLAAPQYAHVELLNSLGQLVFSMEMKQTPQTIDLSWLTGGIFTFKVKHGSMLRFQKFIKQ